MKRIVAVALAVLSVLYCKAQLEATSWFLPNNHFQIKPTGITTGLPVPAQFITGIRTTSVSDAQGNLLFACNGSTIIDRDLNKMPALTNNTLNGGTNKVLIQQIPGSNKYYVFYEKQSDPTSVNSKSTLSYAIVDMSLNGGKGDVTVYDYIVDTLVSPTFTLVQQGGGPVAWLITHRYQTDSFYNYKITASGISTTPVKNKAGLTASAQEYIFRDLKTSYDGKIIAGATYKDHTNLFAYTTSILEVYDFNNATGELSYRVRTGVFPGYYYSFKSLEFSPDNRLLYLLESTNVYGLQPCGFGSGNVNQFNLCYTDSVDFYRFRTSVAQDFEWCYPGHSWISMQLGADKRMHFPFNGVLVSVLNNPNRIGTYSNYVFDSYHLPEGNMGQKTTTEFHHALLEKAVKNNIVYKGGCQPDPVLFHVTNDTISSIQWDFGDPASGPGNTSTQLAPQHIFSSPGIYTVVAKLYNSNNSLIETIEELVEIKDPGKRILNNFPKDTTLCAGQSLYIDLSVVNGIYYWYKIFDGRVYDEQVTDHMIIQYTGTYYVEMRQNDCDGCIMTDSIKVEFMEAPTVQLSPDFSFCSGDSAILLTQNSLATYQWSTGETTGSITVKQGGTYWVKASYVNGCNASDTVVITERPGVNFKLPGDTVLCDNQSLLLNPAIPNASYIWQDGSGGQSYLVTNPGVYHVRITAGNGCTKSDTILVNYVSGAQLNLGTDTSLCTGQTLVLNTGLSNVTHLWNTGATSSQINISSSGNYWVRVSNGNCVATDTIRAIFNQPPVLNLGKDTTLCTGEFILLHPDVSDAVYKWHDGSTGTTFAAGLPGIYWVEIFKGGCVVRDSISIINYNSQKVNLGNDFSFCKGDSAVLKAGSGYKAYLWSNGSTSSSIVVKAAGTYSVAATGSDNCTVRDTVIVPALYNLPVINLDKISGICSGESYQLNAGSGFKSYNWSTGATSSSISVNKPGMYKVIVHDNNNCYSSDSVEVKYLYPLPSVFLPADTLLCSYDEVLLKPKKSYDAYLWSTGSTLSQLLVKQPGIYWLQVIDNNKCKGTDTITILPKECITGIFVPNAFTPNNDALNDVFRPVVAGAIKQFSFEVFNRWGELVYKTNEKNKGWDGLYKGQQQPPGLYVWKCVYELEGSGVKTISGSFTLIR